MHVVDHATHLMRTQPMHTHLSTACPLPNVLTAHTKPFNRASARLCTSSSHSSKQLCCMASQHPSTSEVIGVPTSACTCAPTVSSPCIINTTQASNTYEEGSMLQRAGQNFNSAGIALFLRMWWVRIWGVGNCCGVTSCVVGTHAT